VSRPTKPIDLGQLEKLAILHCTDDEIASFLGITVRTLRRRKQNPAFAAVLENGRNKAKAMLRRLQFEKAQQGNVTMLIWLGKQILGQNDHVEHEPDRPRDAPIPVEQVRSKLFDRLTKRAAFARRTADPGFPGTPGPTATTRPTTRTGHAGDRVADGGQETGN
jgi:hypothetical protein